MTRIQPQTRQNARHLRHEMTRQERLLWSRLREVNRMLGTHFRRQAPIGPYIADFADLGRRLMIEVDGSGMAGKGMPGGMLGLSRRDSGWCGSGTRKWMRIWKA